MGLAFMILTVRRQPGVPVAGLERWPTPVGWSSAREGCHERAVLSIPERVACGERPLAGAIGGGYARQRDVHRLRRGAEASRMIEPGAAVPENSG